MDYTVWGHRELVEELQKRDGIKAKVKVPDGWTYLERYGSVYKVIDGHLWFAPVFFTGVCEMENQTEVELENIEPEIAEDLRKTFNLK